MGSKICYIFIRSVIFTNAFLILLSVALPAYADPSKQETFIFIKDRVSNAKFGWKSTIQNVNGYCGIKQSMYHSVGTDEHTRTYEEITFNLADMDPSAITLEIFQDFARIVVYAKGGKKVMRVKSTTIGSNATLYWNSSDILSKDAEGVTSKGEPYVEGSTNISSITLEVKENINLDAPKVKKAIEYLIRSCGGTNDLF